MSAIDAILNPRSIALIGASAAAEKAGGRRWKTLVEGGFDGALYPIHPKAAQILGRKAYPSVRALPGPIDLAVVIVSPADVPQVVADSIEQGARGIVVITAGFSEISERGRLIEEELVRMAHARGARFFGPNCAGIYSGPAKVNVVGWEMNPGRIGLISQSGNMALDFADLSRRSGEGFSRAVTIGNAADIKSFEFIDYCFNDPETDVVLAYLEGFGPMEGRLLCDLVANAATRKPVILLKPGKSEGGRRAAASHTGSLAGEDRLIDAALKQHGILRVSEVEEAWQTAVSLSRRMPMKGTGIAVLTDGGGHATLFCDAAGISGMATPPLAEETRMALGRLLPERCAMANPVDFAGVAEGDPGVIPKALDICLSDPAISAAVMVGHFGGYEKLGGPALRPLEVAAAHDMIDVARRHQKPVHVHSVHADASPPALAVLRDAGVPVHRSIEMPAKTLRQVFRASARHDRGRAAVAECAPSPDGLRPSETYRGASWLQESEARTLLRSWGIAVPDWVVAASADDCADAAQRFGRPVVLKLIAQGALHKSDIGGVLLDVEGRSGAADAYRELLARARAAALTDVRVLVTPMIRGSAEIVVGAVRDVQFGPAVMVGMGGVLVELLDDVSFRLAPVSHAEATEMLDELKGARLFRGYRGADPLDIQAIPALLTRLSVMMARCPEIREVDVNPIIVSKDGAFVADARVVLDPAAGFSVEC